MRPRAKRARLTNFPAVVDTFQRSAEIADLLHPVPDPVGRWIATGALAE